MTFLLRQLHAIRRRREDDAIRLTRLRERETLAAQQALHRAEHTLQTHRRQARQAIAAAWNGIIGKNIPLKRITQVRALEAAKQRRNAALETGCDNHRQNVKTSQEAEVTANKNLNAARRAVSKLDIAISRQERAQKEIRERQDDNLIDELASQAHARKQAEARSRRRSIGAPKGGAPKGGALAGVALGVAVFFAAGLFGAPGAPQAAVLPNTPLHYETAGHPLDEALRDLSVILGVPVRAMQIPDLVIQGTFQAPNARLFMDRITEPYMLDWTFNGAVIIVTPRSLRQRETFTFSSEQSMQGFLELLENEASLIGTAFPLTITDDRTAITAQGSPAWIDTLTALRDDHAGYQGIQSVSASPGNDRGVMIFRLRHAWAEDKTYTLSDGSDFTIPGIASLLRQLAGSPDPIQNITAIQMPNSLMPLPRVPGRKELQQQMIDAAALAARNAQIPSAPPPPAGTPVVLADVRQNAVVIHGSLDRYDYYKTLVRDLDQEVKLVEIGAMIMDVSKSRIHELGIDWQLDSGGGGIGFGDIGDDLTAPGHIGLSLGKGALGSALGSSLDGFVAQIRALETTGESRIISLPSILTMDNLEAVIDTTEKFFLRVEGHQDTSLYPVTVATKLRVTPHIIQKDDGEFSIQLLVSIRDGSFSNTEENQVDGLPTVRENSINTQAIVAHADSLLIGGQVHRLETSTTTKVPLLGDLPILGLAFRGESVQSEEFVRMFLIRPIVQG